MKGKILLLVFTVLSFLATKAQVVEISANAGTSTNPALGSSNYVANESIYTETELGGAGNFITAGTAINRMSLNVNTLGAPTSFASVNIYFKDVPLATTTFTTGTYTTAGYTLAFSGTLNFTATGWTEFALSTPYVRAAGTNLQMLIERTDGVTHSGYVWICANGNNTSSTVNSTRRYNSTTPLSGSTSLAVSAFRQAVRFAHRYNNDLAAVALYTLGKVPIPNGTPRTDSCNITNQGLNTLTNINVTLNVTGANSFSDTKVISSLAPGASKNVVFTTYTPTVEGTNTITISTPSDDFNGNNSLNVSQVVNKNTWSYAYGSTASGGVGFNGATGDFVAKFTTNAATSISQISVNFFAGGQPYQIGIWDATGAGGTPGTNLWTSASQTSATGVNVLPVSPAQNIPAGDFYVGVKQTGTTNVSFAYQTETPIRSNTFYFTSPTGGTSWTDFAPGNSFRFMIEPKLILPVDASAGSLTVPSNITCYSSPQTFTAVLTNTGANTIAPNAAAVTLRVRGANTHTATVNNTTSIASGGTETITFTGINISNPGTNFDTLFVNLPGDLDKSNDTTKTSNFSASSISAFPFTEKFENATLDFGYVSVLAGARNLVTLQTGNYTNVDLGGTLSPHSTNKMIVFDNYSGASSSGVQNRLFSNCVAIPANAAGQCGNYQMSFWMSHDNSYTTALDSMYVSITTNNGATWTRLSPGYGRIDPAFTVPGWKKEVIDLSTYAGQTIQIGFEDVSKYGNIIALDDIEISSAAAGGLALATTANNGVSLIKSCDDQGWTYYVDPGNVNQPLFAIQWDPASAGANVAAKAAAVPKIQLDANFYAAEDIPNKKATYTMKRYWDVDLGASTLTAPVNIRFFYDSTERNAITTAAQTFATANAGVVEPATWFKTASGAFVPNATNVLPDGVQNAIALTNTNSSNTGSINGVLYAQFNGVTSFSGGTYATGVGTNTPVPVKVEYFRGSKQGNSHVLDWKVVPVNTTSGTLTLERSSDSRNFSSIYSITATALRMQQPFSYTSNNPLNGINYYRLKMVDDNGVVTYSSIVVLMNAVKGFEVINITPNPVTEGRFKLNITSAEAMPITVMITDLAGRVLQQQKANITSGFTAVEMNVSNLAKGAYQVYGVTADGRTRVLQFVKQ